MTPEQEKQALGRIAYEAAAKVTGCDQSWDDANQAKWIAAAEAVVRGRASGQHVKNLMDGAASNCPAMVAIDPYTGQRVALISRGDEVRYIREDLASGQQGTKPVCYGIFDKNGDMYISEHCIGEERDMRDELEVMQADEPEKGWEVLPMFAASPQITSLAEKPKVPVELPQLFVTRGDGVPLPDQTAALKEFMNQARLAAPPISLPPTGKNPNRVAYCVAAHGDIWTANVFHGAPPEGYASWDIFIASEIKRGAFIRAAVPSDYIVGSAQPPGEA